MAKVSLYNKFRPQRFSEVVEQDAIKQVLTYELQNNQLKHVLLFTGPAGCGKTTSARIFANEIEKEPSNIIEINCADHTGVEDVRNLIIDRSVTKPIVGKYKVFILDESHQLTIQASNALLKILEEPPTHCIYIMCTTDPQKVLSTILSRVFRYDFQLISHQGILNQLNKVLTLEKQDPDGCGVQSWESNALDLIATQSAGHMRDALNLLDKAVSYSKDITVDNVVKVLGVTNYDILFAILDAILAKDEATLLLKIDELNKSGIDLKLFIKNFLTFVLDINKYIIMKISAKDLDVMNYLTIPRNYEERMFHYTMTHKPILKQLLTTLLELNSSIRWETNVKPVLETNLLMEVL